MSTDTPGSEALMLDDPHFVGGYLSEMAAHQLAAGPFPPTLQDIQALNAAAKLLSASSEKIAPHARLLERCRAICMRVGMEAHEAAKAKDATDYIAGYQDASVDIDEEIRELIVEPLSAIGTLPEANELARMARDATRWRALKELAGYYQDGSQQTVKLYQDDAMRSCFIEAGRKTYGTDGSSFDSAMDQAMEAQANDEHR